MPIDLDAPPERGTFEPPKTDKDWVFLAACYTNLALYEAQALLLHERGAEPERIAAVTGHPVDNVEGWILSAMAKVERAALLLRYVDELEDVR